MFRLYPGLTSIYNCHTCGSLKVVHPLTPSSITMAALLKTSLPMQEACRDVSQALPTQHVDTELGFTCTAQGKVHFGTGRLSLVGVVGLLAALRRAHRHCSPRPSVVRTLNRRAASARELGFVVFGAYTTVNVLELRRPLCWETFTRGLVGMVFVFCLQGTCTVTKGTSHAGDGVPASRSESKGERATTQTFSAPHAFLLELGGSASLTCEDARLVFCTCRDDVFSATACDATAKQAILKRLATEMTKEEARLQSKRRKDAGIRWRKGDAEPEEIVVGSPRKGEGLVTESQCVARKGGSSASSCALEAHVDAVQPDVAACTSGTPTLHRWWLNRSRSPKLPEICRLSLRSFSPEYRQIMWTYGDVEGVDVPNVVTRDATLIVPRSDIDTILHRGGTAQHVSDLFKTRVVFLCGGMAADLDILFLGKPFQPISGDYLLHSEPERGETLPYAHQGELVVTESRGQRSTFNLAFFCGPRGAPFYRRAAATLLETWDGFPRCHSSTRITALTNARIIWSVIAKMAEESTETGRMLRRARMSPMSCCPLPRWIRQWGEQQASEQSGYLVPAAVDIEQQSSAIQLWAEKWPTALLRQVIDWATALRSKRRGSPLSRGIHETRLAQETAVRRLLMDWTPRLIHLVDEPELAFAILSTASGLVRECLSGDRVPDGSRTEPTYSRAESVAAAFLCFGYKLHAREVETKFGESRGCLNAVSQIEGWAGKVDQVRAALIRVTNFVGSRPESLAAEHPGTPHTHTTGICASSRMVEQINKRTRDHLMPHVTPEITLTQLSRALRDNEKNTLRHARDHVETTQRPL